ncbi:MAG: DNA polymerase Y family protein, partial [Gammaproteobacteria bacterium]|nr:DNA polymerase Y family protein [Gammaproteobacteria bacterium]
LIAEWAQEFTSHVSIVSVDKILMEIRGSLDFFSGLSLMLEKLESSFSKKFEHDYHLAVSPSPLASELLSESLPDLLCESGSESRRRIIIENDIELRPVVGNMSLDLFLMDNVSLLKKIRKTGVKTVQDLWRLPRDGLARRFGVQLLKKLDRLTTTTADPRLIHQLPLRYEEEIELPMETSSSKIIIWAAKRLFEKLERFLRESDTGIVNLHIHLKHQGSDKKNSIPGSASNSTPNSTKITLRLRQMSRSASHMLALFSEKMERTYLPSGVIDVFLSVDEILPFVVFDQHLFSVDGKLDAKNKSDPDWENTLEQLQNRLGKNSVCYLRVMDEINPDLAWCYQPDLSVMHHSGTAVRPLWLLNSPIPLKFKKNMPDYRGPLKFLLGPERIQTGWWRGEEKNITRDYYIALSANDGYLWVFRDLKQRNQWYLHGFF